MKNTFLFILLVLICVACAENTAVEMLTEKEPYTFLNGLWHGIIAPITLVISFFKEDVAMYGINNVGGWYNFGFFFGITMICGGTHKASRKRCDKE